MHPLLIILFSLLLPLFSSVKEPILILPLTTTAQNQFQTTFSLGGSSVRWVDLNYESIDVCCKNKKTVLDKIYYFMLNPFQIDQDYLCHFQKNGTAQDVAKFQKIGPVTVNFNEQVYPHCKIGRLGLSKHSTFLHLLPKNQQYFIISRESQNSQSKQLKLKVGGSYNEHISYFQKHEDKMWKAQFKDVIFNDISLGSQQIAVTSNKYQIKIPYKPFQVIRSQLLRNFGCIQVEEIIYCPCNEGVSHSYPLLKMVSKQIIVNIQPQSYMSDMDEICKTMISSTSQAYWSINLLMLNSVDLIFDFQSKRLGMATHRMSIQTSDSINQPLQVILNSVVILLMCLFVAMILIQVVKQITGIENAGMDSFENYMLKHAEQ